MRQRRELVVVLARAAGWEAGQCVRLLRILIAPHLCLCCEGVQTTWAVVMLRVEELKNIQPKVYRE